MVYEGRLKSNRELREKARENLSGNWVIAILVCVIAWIFTQMFISGPEIKTKITIAMSDPIRAIVSYGGSSEYGRIEWVGILISLILAGPIAFGTSMFFLNLTRNANAKLQDVFGGFKYFGKTFLMTLLITLFILLWGLLLVIPGIIAAFNYSMSYYILIDNPELGYSEAVERSKDMMCGQKGKLFFLYLSFAGWFILSLLTLGIGFIWLEPYVQASLAAFYEYLKDTSNDKLEDNGSEGNY